MSSINMATYQVFKINWLVQEISDDSWWEQSHMHSPSLDYEASEEGSGSNEALLPQISSHRTAKNIATNPSYSVGEIWSILSDILDRN